MFKKIISFVLALGVCFSLSLNVYALDTPNALPRADTTHYYINKNKVIIQRNVIVSEVQVVTPQVGGHIAYTETKSTTFSLSVAPTAGVFTSAAAIASGDFTVSISTSGTETHDWNIDPGRKAVIVLRKEANKVQCDQYWVIDYGTTTSETYKGSGIVIEPTGYYYDLKYLT